MSNKAIPQHKALAMGMGYKKGGIVSPRSVNPLTKVRAATPPVQKMKGGSTHEGMESMSHERREEKCR